MRQWIATISVTFLLSLAMMIGVMHVAGQEPQHPCEEYSPTDGCIVNGVPNSSLYGDA